MRRTFLVSSFAAVVAALFLAGPTSSAPTDEQLCLAAKEKALSKLEQCVWKARAKATQTGQTLDTSLCETKFSESWSKPDAKYGADCPAATSATISSLFADHVAEVLGEISAPASDCGNGTIDAGEDCDGSNVGGATCSGLGYGNGGAVTCSGTCDYVTSGCSGCSVFAQDCPVGSDSCTIDGAGATTCAPPGTNTTGQDCTSGGCVESNACVEDGDGPECRQFCQVSNSTCGAGFTCATLVGYDDIGVCYPN